MSTNTDIINFYSYILDKETQMSVYLPEGYNHFDYLPVLYFLHGRSGNENIMFELDISVTAERMIKSKAMNPLIIICPNIENSRGINSSLVCKEVIDANNRTINLGMYEDFLIKEIIPFIDRTYNTIKDRKGRYIGGASAGGYAALHNAFRHQDMFSKVGGHMPALELELTNEDKPYFKGKGVWEKYDPLNIIRNNEINLEIEVYLDAGDKDRRRILPRLYHLR